MTVRFVLDESSWSTADGSGSALEHSVLALLERLDVASERQEPVCRHDAFYRTSVGNGRELFHLLFDATSSQLERDVAERLRFALDRAALLDEGELVSLDATFLDRRYLAPGVSWAHARAEQEHAVAVLPLPLDRRARGVLAVTVEDVTRDVHFVATDQEHLEFFRCAIELEDMGHAEVRAIASSAFPAIEWLPGAWSELRANHKYFFGPHRPTLVKHLSVLNDSAANFFHIHAGGEGVAEEFGSQGVDASSENGKARSHKPSIRDRTRTYNGTTQVFWWHTKITPELGRIHFLHVPARPNDGRPLHGHIVIGIFRDHCALPN